MQEAMTFQDGDGLCGCSVVVNACKFFKKVMGFSSENIEFEDGLG